MRGENLRLRAMALTYLTLFALVPGLVVAFAVVNALTGTEHMARLLNEYLLENLAVGARAGIEPHLDEFVRNARAVTGAGWVGAALVLLSAIILFGQVEHAIDSIWAVQQRRSRGQKLVMYWGGLTLGPLLIAASVTLARAASGGSLWLAKAGSVVLTCAFFALMYLIVPATRVRLLPALAGGLTAGLLFEAAKALYKVIVARFFNYSAVYGSLAAILVLLIWIYLSWTVLLFGARLAFVLQHAKVLFRPQPDASTPRARALLAAQVMLEVALAHDRGAAPDPGEVAERLAMPAEIVREVLAELAHAGLTAAVVGGGVVPGRSLDRITLADVRRVVEGAAPSPEAGTSAALLEHLLGGAETLAATRLGQTSFEALVERLRPPKPAA
jgi:membrane protein